MTSNLINRFNYKIVKSIKILSNTIKQILCEDKLLIVYWWKGDGGKNWGDSLNPVLIKKLSGKEPVSSDEIINLKNEPIYSVVGSILEHKIGKNLIVWGSGFISSTSQFKIKPNKICAVRGPLTRDLIIKQGIDCPEIYGDPALLYPLFYKPHVKKEYQIGIIPHYIDQSHPLLSIFRNNPNVLIIDITSRINEVIDNICKCKIIASSSLHGIIAADAYEIPSIWIEISDKIIGNRFKFYDYFQSVGRFNESPILITENTTLQDIYNQYREYKINIDLIKLIEACPFIKDSNLNEFKERIEKKAVDI